MVAIGRALMSSPRLHAHGRAVDGSRAGARRAELRDHQAGERRPASRSSSSSRTRTCRSRSPTAATCSRPAAWCSRGRPPSCWSTTICARPTSADNRSKSGASRPMTSTGRLSSAAASGSRTCRLRRRSRRVALRPVRFADGRRHREAGRRHPRRVPDLRAHDLPQLVLPGRALSACAPSLRGVPRRLGRARRRVGPLGRARGGRPRRVRAPAAGRAGRGRGHDLRHPGGERDRQRAAARARRPHEDRDQRVRVPDGRPDRACAGAPRSRGRPRAPRGGRVDLTRALRRGGRRADGARLLHDGLLPDRPPPRRRRDRPHRPRRGRALPRRLVPGGRRDRLRRPGTRRRLRNRRHGQVPARLVGARLPLRPPRAARRSPPHPNRLVRGRGHLPDGHLRLLAGGRRATLRRGHAAGAEHLRGPRRHLDRRGGGDARDRGACRRSRRAADRRARRARRHRRHAARAVTPRPARLRPLEPTSTRSSPPSPRSGSSAPSATRTCASRCTSTTSTKTSTGCSKRSAGTARSSPEATPRPVSFRASRGGSARQPPGRSRSRAQGAPGAARSRPRRPAAR